MIQLILALLKLAFALLSVTFTIFKKFFSLFRSSPSPHGSASWHSGFGLFRLLNRWNKGLVLDGRRRISQENSFRHLIIAAPSGGGKTSKFVIPNMLMATGSVVVTDPSGEIYERTAGYLASQGYTIKVLNVTQPDHSLWFNPLERAKNHTQIMELCESLISAAYPNQGGDSAFWNAGAASVLNALIRAVMADSPEHRNLANVRHLLNNFGHDGADILDYISERVDTATMHEWRGILSSDSKVLLGAIATARTALGKFADPDLCRVSAMETLRFESLRKEKTALYLIVPEEKISYYSFYTSLLYKQLFDFCMKSPAPDDQPIYFLMDEFGQMKVPGFASIATTIRRKKCSLSLILQDLSQLQTNYTKAEADTIVNGACSSKLFFPGLSSQTCDQVEHLLGKQTIQHRDKSGSAHEMGTPLLSSDEVRRLSQNRGIYVFFNEKPVLLKTKAYYESGELKNRSRMPTPELNYPPAPQVSLIDLEAKEEHPELDFSH